MRRMIVKMLPFTLKFYINKRFFPLIKLFERLQFHKLNHVDQMKISACSVQSVWSVYRSYYLTSVSNRIVSNFTKTTKSKKNEEVPEKKPRQRATKKEKTLKEEQITSSKSDEMLTQNKKTTKAATKKSKKEEAEEEPQTKNVSENGTVKKKATSKKAKAAESDEEEASTTSKEKKPTATKGKRGKKTENEESQQTEEEAIDTKKGRKRKAPAKANDVEAVAEEPKTKTVKNATSTNWEKIDFTCSTKNSKGNTSNFHITSWNVDGLRAWLKKGGLNILEHDQPDIFCVQETKCSVDKLPEEATDIKGYEKLWCSSEKDGYAGVGIYTKVKPLSVKYGIDSEEHDNEGRCITAEYEKFYLINVYVPNAGRKLVTLPKRLEWNKLFKEHIKKLDKVKPVIVCGDMNVAHSEIDLANPKTNTKNAGFTKEEREGMTDFLGDGYVDTFRQLYPDKEKAYTFWTYMANARTKNVGWRLDYFIVSKRFMENVCDNIIHSDVLGSDHCPLSLFMNI